MDTSQLLSYLFFGYSFIVATIAFVLSDHLWKLKFFKRCLIYAVISFAFGVILEITNLLQQLFGLTILLMSTPLIYLTYFQILRKIFIKWTGGEPYITSASSTIGAPPLDLFTSAGKDRKRLKFSKDRKITYSDFLFSFLQALLPISTITGLMFVIMLLNGK